MKPNRTFLILVIPTSAMVLLAGCSSVVKKPEIQAVKKVAIVSLNLPINAPWTGNNASTNRITSLTEWDGGDQAGEQVALAAYNAYSEEFRKMGWTVTPLAQVTGNEEYKNLVKGVTNRDDFYPPGLFSIRIPKTNHVTHQLHQQQELRRPITFDMQNISFNVQDQELPKIVASPLTTEYGMKKALRGIASSLKADMVVLISYDVCYTGAGAFLGNGPAKFTAASWVNAIDSRGEYLIKMSDILEPCEGTRAEGDSTVTMIGGKITAFKDFDKAASKERAEAISDGFANKDAANVYRGAASVTREAAAAVTDFSNAISGAVKLDKVSKAITESVTKSARMTVRELKELID